jgi:hypothetical protein
MGRRLGIAYHCYKKQKGEDERSRLKLKRGKRLQGFIRVEASVRLVNTLIAGSSRR